MGINILGSHDEADQPLVEFTRTSLEFATWHPDYHFEEVEVVVTANLFARCGITATSPELGKISSGASGRDEYDAVDRATVLLEMEMNRRISLRERRLTGGPCLDRRTRMTGAAEPAPASFN